MSKKYYVYMMTNHDNSVLYTGVTDNIHRRVEEHRNKVHKGFTARYNVYKLVYVETTDYINNALQREKQIKGMSRQKKDDLVNSMNPEWRDLLADE